MSEIIVLNLHGHNKYFVDTNRMLTKSSLAHQGNYQYTLIYPRFSMTTQLFGYTNQTPYIYFDTMVFIGNYLVRTNLQIITDPFNPNTLIDSINKFHEHCKNLQNTLNPKTILKLCQKEK